MVENPGSDPGASRREIMVERLERECICHFSLIKIHAQISQF